MLCPKCQTQNLDDARMCSHCGAPFQEEASIQPQTEIQPNSSPVLGHKLRGSIELTKETLKAFKNRWKIFVAIQLIPTIFSVIIASIISYWTYQKNPSLLYLVLVIGLIIPASIISFWGTCALMVSVVRDEQGKTWKNYYKEGIKVFWGILGVSLLVGLVVTIGAFFLIVPGIIFSIWFAYAVWAYIDKGKDSGVVNALKESKRLVKGYFWQIVWRTLVFSVFVLVASLIAYFILGLIVAVLGKIIGENQFVASLVDNIFRLPIQLVITPVSLLYPYLIYKELKQLKLNEPSTAPIKKSTKVLIVILIIVGASAILGLFAILPLAALKSARSKSQDTERISDIKQIETVLKLYYSENSLYPNTLEELEKYLPDIPVDPKTSKFYDYQTSNSNSNFKICANLETDIKESPYCLEGSGSQEEQSQPESQDTDGDGLSDAEETNIYKTDPLNSDTDGDGYIDGEEVNSGYDPLEPPL